MTEREKALAGKLYDASYDKELIELRLKVKNLCHKYNHLPPTNLDERKQILGNILGKMTNNILIEQPFTCDYGANIEVGDKFYSNHNCVILDGAKVVFGDNVMIGPNCGFYTAGHPLCADQRNTGIEYAYPITVGNNVWIGGGTTVLAGVTIGDNSVIGAGSVVNRSIPPNVVSVGNPCKVLREITDEDYIK